MIEILKKRKSFIATLALTSIVILALFYDALKPKEKLAIYQHSMVNYELVDSTLQHKKKFHKIAPFSLTNQNGLTITEKDYMNKIYVADFFFTTCPSICPKMTANMGLIQENIKTDNQVLLISFSVTPEIDSVSVLKKYSMEMGVLDSKWNMVTGDKSQIYNLARKSYLVAEDIESSNFYDMIHTENFVLVDSRRRIRGFYDGTDSESMNQLIEDVYILKKEF